MPKKKKRGAAAEDAIATLVFERFRVFRERTELPIAPLTLLAGANSSGKSSAMLPVLLLKQTLDAPFDPGPLLLNGGHAAIASFDDLRTRDTSGPVVFGIETTRGQSVEVHFDRDRKGEIAVQSMKSQGARGPAATLEPGRRYRNRRVERVRFLLGGAQPRAGEVYVPPPAQAAIKALEGILHVPGLRSPPQRDYPVTAVGETFEGRFDRYMASVLAEWQRSSDKRLALVATDLAELGLTWKVRARRKSDTQVSLEVGRLPRPARGGAYDLVEIADVGVGVSQALPVLVALRHATPGQLAYIEQPELHLHPRAQTAMGNILVAAAQRRVRVIVETHSSLVLLAIQAAIARGVRGLRPDDVVLHWFNRDPRSGDTTISTHYLTGDGALPDSPVDFDEVELEAHAAYLDAVERG